MKLVENVEMNYLEKKFNVELTGAEILVLYGASAKSNTEAVCRFIEEEERNEDFAKIVRDKDLPLELYKELKEICLEIKQKHGGR